MGFTGKNPKKPNNSTGTTVIATGTVFTGDIELKDNLHLDGCLEGKLTSQADVGIGRSGRFKGEIHAKRVLVSGVLEGRVDADRLEIVATGKVTGEITVCELVVESGGQFIGDSQIKKPQAPNLKPVENNVQPGSGSQSV